MSLAGTPAFHTVLRDAVERRGLSLERISAHLRARGHMVSIATLSYWQSGRSTPGRPATLRAVGALEAILGTPRGSLAHLVPQPVAEPPSTTSFGFVSDRGVQMETLAAEMGLDWGDQFEDVALHTRAFVDERGLTDYTRCRSLVRVLEPTSLYVMGTGHLAPGTPIALTPVLGCSLDRVAARPEASLCVGAFRLPDLRVGDYHAFEYEMAYQVPAAHGMTSEAVFSGSTAPLKQLYVEVSFTPGAVPTAVTRIDTGPGGAGETTVSPREGFVSMHRFDFGPGRGGFSWDLRPPT